MRTTPRRRHVLLRSAGLAGAAALLLGTAPATAAEAPGSGVGWIRVGHLSPQVPPVDIYFAPFGKPEKVVIRKAGYGSVTGYSSVDPGAYTLSMRPVDAAPTSPPALTATITVDDAHAYSLLVFADGPDGTLNGDFVNDDLTAPAAGNGRVRVVQGSASYAPVSVTGPGDKVVADGAAYGITTPYGELPQGRWPLKLVGGGTSGSATVDVKAGSSTTLLVTEGADSLTAVPIADGAALPDAPKLGVETGGGGTAIQPGRDFAGPWAAGGILAALVALAAWPKLRRRVARAR
ncbi:DUF4397 domain-containing protein [Amycolatopsis sp. H20-H5]|uniref:DUF4397 domain-containing protein n=1 Tax=Amycolatopsis sp. H20-H5 TaxID=3046309 RepID=UPI002DBCAE7D|nr:DUF4397 domain-containing protein [Amycolatopsis sp. H20-H5]MEC3980901.1 DUF4397 domain-containing protein [Amycolatopsis sp. H20-H5]